MVEKVKDIIKTPVVINFSVGKLITIAILLVSSVAAAVLYPIKIAQSGEAKTTIFIEEEIKADNLLDKATFYNKDDGIELKTNVNNLTSKVDDIKTIVIEIRDNFNKHLIEDSH